MARNGPASSPPHRRLHHQRLQHRALIGEREAVADALDQPQMSGVVPTATTFRQSVPVPMQNNSARSEADGPCAIIPEESPPSPCTTGSEWSRDTGWDQAQCPSLLALDLAGRNVMIYPAWMVAAALPSRPLSCRPAAV
jgi:hypothetical protein